MKLDLRPLKLKPFRRIWVAEAINIAGDWLGLIALTVLVYDRTGKSLATALLFVSFRFLPALAGPALVSRIESLPARRSLPLIYVCEAAMFALLAIQADGFSLAVVALLAFVDGCFGFSGRTLIRSSTAGVLKPVGQFEAGNALLNVVFTWGFFVFPALAGAVVASIGVGDALLLNTATFLVAALTLLEVEGLPDGVAQATAWRERLREGIRYARSHVPVRALLLATGLVVAVTDIVYPVEIILVKSTFGAGNAGYGLFLATWGAGMATGGLWFALRRPKRLPRVLLVSVVLLGVSFAATAAAPTFAVACAIQAIGGLGNGIQVVALFTLVQELIEDDFQARIVSLTNTVMEAMPGVGFIVGGVLGVFLAPRGVFLVTGLGTLLVSSILLLTMRSIRWTREAEEKPEESLRRPVTPSGAEPTA